jgi:hypothetical protein
MIAPQNTPPICKSVLAALTMASTLHFCDILTDDCKGHSGLKFLLKFWIKGSMHDKKIVVNTQIPLTSSILINMLK